jgi:multidrug transporter EmrE-like cation transporter
MLLLIFPVALLVAYSQIVVKWRMLNIGAIDMQNMTLAARMLKYLTDPFILSAYGAAFFSSLVWMYIVTKLPLALAFPIYIGITFVLVIAGGWYFLSETVPLLRIASVTLILIGIILGVKS